MFYVETSGNPPQVKEVVVGLVSILMINLREVVGVRNKTQRYQFVHGNGSRPLIEVQTDYQIASAVVYFLHWFTTSAEDCSILENSVTKIIYTSQIR